MQPGSSFRHLAGRATARLALALAALATAANAERFTFDSPDAWGGVTPLAGDVPGLQSLDIRFTQGQNNVHVLGVGPSKTIGASDWDLYTLQLSDSTHGPFGWQPGGEDPTAGSAEWVDLREHASIRQGYRDDCVGICRIPIPRLQQGEVFVLLGFDFQFLDGQQQIKEIGVNTHTSGPYNGYVEVTFNDASGTRPYYAFVQYAAVSMWEFRNHYQTYDYPAYSTATAPRASGPAVLRGFRLAFLDGQHPLYRMSVSVATHNNVYVRLRDNTQSRPFYWWVAYSTLD